MSNAERRRELHKFVCQAGDMQVNSMALGAESCLAELHAVRAPL